MNNAGDEQGYVLAEALTVVAVVSALALVGGASLAGELRRLDERVSELAWRRQYATFARAAQAASDRVELPFYLLRHEEVLERTAGRVAVGYVDRVATRRLEVVARDAGRHPRAPVAVELRVGGVVTAELNGLESARVMPWVGGEELLWGLAVTITPRDGSARRFYLRFGTPGGTI
ncbi:MAG: hypothetical protein ACQETQ_10140 [Spirochaetota bacterium]